LAISSGLAAAARTSEQQGSKAAAGSLGNGDKQAERELAHKGQIQSDTLEMAKSDRASTTPSIWPRPEKPSAF
jgi:hypothetical protein